MAATLLKTVTEYLNWIKKEYENLKMINEQVLRAVLNTLAEVIYSQMKKDKTGKEKEDLEGYEETLLKLINEKLIE